MERFLTLAALLLLSAEVAAQRLEPERYIYPVRNVSGYCSANFGEMRPDHFHSGVDIKTDGVEGKPIAAVADGYISRVVDGPSGYGRALYVDHPDGTMSVYGHLSRFRSDIDSAVMEFRYSRKTNSADIQYAADRFPVRQGDIIGFSGNTGNSFGPHLHFEIRHKESNSTLNLIEPGVIKVRDTIPPIISALWYAGVDTVGIVPVHTAPQRIEIRRTGRGRYTTDKPVKVYPKGYFIIETTDRKNGVHNRYGIYRVTESIDGIPIFEYRMDGYNLADTRYCNAVSYYPLQLLSRGEDIRLAALEGGSTAYYPTLVDRGVVRPAADGSRHVTIVVEDDCRNRSTLDFEITGGAALPATETATDSLTIDRTADFAFGFEDISVAIPAGALYESAFFKFSRSERLSPENISAATPLYDLMDSDTPLHKAATVSIRAYIPEELRARAAIALINAKGRASYLGGTWRGDTIEVKSRKLGTLCVVLDTAAPVIRPQFAPSADMSGKSELLFTVSDNFSGINEYSATIDGHWAALERSPIRGTLYHRFDHRKYGRGKTHTVEITVTDNCGNTAVWRGRFFR